MNFFALFQTILYTISTALLVPVVALLIILCVWLFLYTGSFFGEWIKRRQKRSKTPLSTFLEEICRGRTLPKEVQSMLPAHITAYAQDLEKILKSPGILKAEKIEDLNQKKQHALLKSVDKIRIVVRSGPSLGLMGTLIPMGTGISGVTQGNMAQHSSRLILAFTTTVVGIALGISSYFFTVVKEQWMLEDMRRINLITEAMTNGLSQESAPTDTP